MPRPRSNAPSYLKHSNGQGRMCWRGADGKRLFKLLPGPFDSPESREAYDRACAELTASGTVTDFNAPASKEALAACQMVATTLMKIATTDMPQLEVDEALDLLTRRCSAVVAREQNRTVVHPTSKDHEDCVLLYLRDEEVSFGVLKGILTKKFCLGNDGDVVLANMVREGKIVRECRPVTQGKRRVMITYYKLPTSTHQDNRPCPKSSTPPAGTSARASASSP